MKSETTGWPSFLVKSGPRSPFLALALDAVPEDLVEEHRRGAVLEDHRPRVGLDRGRLPQGLELGDGLSDVARQRLVGGQVGEAVAVVALEPVDVHAVRGAADEPVESRM